MLNITDKTMPKVPYAGMPFTPFTTNSKGTILEVNSTNKEGEVIVNVDGKYNGSVTYSYDHDPKATYTEPYADVKKFSHLGWIER